MHFIYRDDIEVCLPSQNDYLWLLSLKPLCRFWKLFYICIEMVQACFGLQVHVVNTECALIVMQCLLLKGLYVYIKCFHDCMKAIKKGFQFIYIYLHFYFHLSIGHEGFTKKQIIILITRFQNCLTLVSEQREDIVNHITSWRFACSVTVA